MPSPLCVARMCDRNRSRPDRLYLVAIIAYAMMAAGFIGYFIWRLAAG